MYQIHDTYVNVISRFLQIIYKINAISLQIVQICLLSYDGSQRQIATII